MTASKLNRRLQANLEYAQGQLKEFSEELLSDPFHALSWADKQFEFAAHISVSKELLSKLEVGVDLEQIARHLGRQVLTQAMNPPHSTSPSSNLAQVALIKVVAETLEYIEELLG